MEIHAINKFHIDCFWDCEYQNLKYTREAFNDPECLAKWTTMGYTGPFTGHMCDMRDPQPSWNNKFLEIFADRGYRDIGTSYYRMDTGVVLPLHGDLYKKYIELFNLKGQEHTIKRTIVFLENWSSGHYFEGNGVSYANWHAGDAFEWTYDTPHMAANIGKLPRYTLQITGHI
tara:strand:- start:2224 stop:2742 length:519 start_codon:yes stop_codon:yes gene_type:complete